jgi:hypothetical protein
MLESKLLRSIHSSLSHITWLKSHHVISQFCFCIAACDTLTQNMNCERFFIISILSKTIEKSQIALFENSLTNKKFSFLFIFCTRNRHLTVIESYIRRDDVIKCELDLIFIKKLIHYLIFTNDCREDADKLLLSRKTLINAYKLLSRNIW